MLYPELKKAYGPYTRQDGRKHMVLVFKNNSKKTISYPKWLMENHIGRRLLSHETVDHKDRDFTNDDINNLQILFKKEHSSLDARRVKPLELSCIWCGNKTFQRPSDFDGNTKQGRAGPFCGPSCRGKYGKAIQMGWDVPKSNRPEKAKREYYKLEKK